jgi:glyoxylase-like metal-dependent hydrolase (beta-lactamase superfamily II)
MKLHRNSIRFAVALLAALASLVASSNAALAAATQHHDQAPGFYRLKAGDLEVTALYDGTGAFDPYWLNGTKAAMDGVAMALQEDPHMLDTADTGFLVNSGKQLILVDAGACAWWGGGAFGRLTGSLRSAGYTPEAVDILLLTHLHSDHVGGLTTQDGKRVFPNADVYVAKAESDFWLSAEIAAKAPKDAQPFFQSAQAIAAPYIAAGKWHTFNGSERIVDGMELVPLPGHTPGHTGYEFSSKGQKILFGGDIVHAQRVQLQHPEITVVFDIDPTAAAATRNQLLSKLAHEVLIATPHSSFFPPVGRLRQEGNGYSWAPVTFTDQWEKNAAQLTPTQKMDRVTRLLADARVRTVRIFADGDYAVAQTDYNFGGAKVGFESFRFDGDKIIEHWNNLEDKCAAPNLSGRTQLDGPTTVTDLDQTDANKSLMKSYFDDVVLGGQRDKVAQYRSADSFHQHNCDGEDNKSGFQTKTGIFAKPGFVFKYTKVHKILGEGNFVLVVSEGHFDAKPTAFYDLYRIENGKQVEHWDVLETIPPTDPWKNANGKF